MAKQTRPAPIPDMATVLAAAWPQLMAQVEARRAARAAVSS